MTRREAITRETPPDFLTVEEAAAVLRIGRTAAYQLARQYLATDVEAGLPVVKVGKQFRVPRCKLEDYLGGPITWPIPKADSPEDEPAGSIPPRATRRRSTRSGDEPRLFTV